MCQVWLPDIKITFKQTIMSHITTIEHGHMEIKESYEELAILIDSKIPFIELHKPIASFFKEGESKLIIINVSHIITIEE